MDDPRNGTKSNTIIENSMRLVVVVVETEKVTDTWGRDDRTLMIHMCTIVREQQRGVPCRQSDEDRTFRSLTAG